MHLCFVSRPLFLRTLRTSAHLGKNRCGTFIHHKINHSSNAPLTVPNASPNRSPTSAEVVEAAACSDHCAARLAAPLDALKRPSHDGDMHTADDTVPTFMPMALAHSSMLQSHPMGSQCCQMRRRIACCFGVIAGNPTNKFRPRWPAIRHRIFVPFCLP